MYGCLTRKWRTQIISCFIAHEPADIVTFPVINAATCATAGCFGLMNPVLLLGLYAWSFLVVLDDVVLVGGRDAQDD